MDHLIQWAENWKKDDRFSRECTSRLVQKACAIDTQLNNAYREGALKVIAGPHRKAKPNGGGDARWHITVRLRTQENDWHIILDPCVRKPTRIDKREYIGHSF